jgi:hypothetical protein
MSSATNSHSTIGMNLCSSAGLQFVRLISEYKDFIVRLIFMRNARKISSEKLSINDGLSITTQEM